MDIHRCRFIPYPLSAINALAFSHPSNCTAPGKGPSNLRLAIGRANGDIEIWNPLKGAWYQESIIRGAKHRSIEGLAWIQDPEDVDKNGRKVPGKLRLFSIGYSTAVTEWDLALGRPARHSAGDFGEIWCMAAQPKGPSPKKSGLESQGAPSLGAESQVQNIVVGCADGSIVLLSTSDGDIRFNRILARPPKKIARALSITFQNRNTIIAGHADSTIRIYDIRNCQQIRNMTLGSGPRKGPKEILVWSVKCLKDGTIVSGDSTGTVSFWDGKIHTLLQRIKSHEADILDVAVSADGHSVFSGGMDRRTTLYRRTTGGREGEKLRWAKMTHQRLHNHDVKAMATFETRGLSILASGGLDTMPIIVPIQEFGREHHRTLSSLPQQPNIRSAAKMRLIMSWWDHEICIWAIPRSQRADIQRDKSPEASEMQGRRLVAKISLQGEESITSADLSADGGMLSVSTMADLKAFRLRPKFGFLKVQKLEIPPEMSRTGAKSIEFSPDMKWLVVVRADNRIQLYRMTEAENPKKAPQFLQTFVKLKRLSRDSITSKWQHGSLGSYDRAIRHVTFSADSKILAVGDNSGYVDTWVLEGHEDLTQENDKTKSAGPSASSDDEYSDEEDHAIVILGQHWIPNPSASLLIKLPAAPLVLSFRPSTAQSMRNQTNGNVAVHPTRHNPHPHSHDLPDGEDRLFVLTAENNIYEFNVLSGTLSDWSKRNPRSSLPMEFRDQRERAKGFVWDFCRGNERIWLYGVSWLWMFDLSRDFPPLEDQPNKQGRLKNGDVGAKSLKRIRTNDSEDEGRGQRPRLDTGAGSKVPTSELGVGIGRKIQRIDGSEAVNSRWISLDGEQSIGSDEEEDYVLSNESALVSLRRGRDEDHAANGDSGDELDVDGETSPNDKTGVARRADNKPYWHTFKYRPILGIVPLGSFSDEEEDEKDNADDDTIKKVEVALIERPLWDVDLPPQYQGNQEWNQRL